MVNMTYCKFENTYLALQDCLSELQEYGNVNDLMEAEELTDVEKSYIAALVDLCIKISDDYGK